MNILLAVPIGKRDHAEPEMIRGVTDLLLRGGLPIGQVLWGWRDLGGSGSVWHQREYAGNMVREAVPRFSHLLFQDADIGAPVEAYQALVTMQVPVAVGCYATAEEHPVPVTVRNHHGTSRPHLGTGVELVDWAGLGFALIAREVFESVPGPWFASVNEDVAFFTKLQTAGVPVWCDYRITLGHPYTVWVTRDHLIREAVQQMAIVASGGNGRIQLP